MRESILEEKDFKLIKSLDLSPRKRPSGYAAGEQRSPVSGGGIEFAEYREYQAGDDIRQLDWSVFLRLRKLLVKVCAQEKELALAIILDASRSMLFGTGGKFLAAKRIACALAGIALRSGDRAGISVLGSSLFEALKPERSKVSLVEIIHLVDRINPVDNPDPTASMRQFTAKYGKKCLVVFLSDLLYPDWSKTLGQLASSGSEAYVIQVLAPEELNPPLYGETTFVDMEDGSQASLYLDAKNLLRYKNEMSAFLSQSRHECARLGLGYALASSNEELSSQLNGGIRKAGLLC